MGEKHVPANDVISIDAKTSRPPFVEVTSTHAANAHCSRPLETQANDWSTSRASSLVASENMLAFCSWIPSTYHLIPTVRYL